MIEKRIMRPMEGATPSKSIIATKIAWADTDIKKNDNLDAKKLLQVIIQASKNYVTKKNNNKTDGAWRGEVIYLVSAFLDNPTQFINSVKNQDTLPFPSTHAITLFLALSKDKKSNLYKMIETTAKSMNFTLPDEKTLLHNNPSCEATAKKISEMLSPTRIIGGKVIKIKSILAMHDILGYLLSVRFRSIETSSHADKKCFHNNLTSYTQLISTQEPNLLLPEKIKQNKPLLMDEKRQETYYKYWLQKLKKQLIPESRANNLRLLIPILEENLQNKRPDALLDILLFFHQLDAQKYLYTPYSCRKKNAADPESSRAAKSIFQIDIDHGHVFADIFYETIRNVGAGEARIPGLHETHSHSYYWSHTTSCHTNSDNYHIDLLSLINPELTTQQRAFKLHTQLAALKLNIITSMPHSLERNLLLKNLINYIRYYNLDHSVHAVDTQSRARPNQMTMITEFKTLPDQKSEWSPELYKQSPAINYNEMKSLEIQKLLAESQKLLRKLTLDDPDRDRLTQITNLFLKMNQSEEKLPLLKHHVRKFA